MKPNWESFAHGITMAILGLTVEAHVSHVVGMGLLLIGGMRAVYEVGLYVRAWLRGLAGRNPT